MTLLLQMRNTQQAFLWLQLNICNEKKKIFFHIGFSLAYIEVSRNVTVDWVSSILNLFSILLFLMMFIFVLTLFFHLRNTTSPLD